jgi:hypothetical protein
MVVQHRFRDGAQPGVFSRTLPGIPIARKFPVVIRRTLAVTSSLAALAALLSATPAGAASKLLIAALSDNAPGDGVFAGPSFASDPTAAGNGWIAFRAMVIGGSTSEVIAAFNMVTGAQAVVASIGQTVDPAIGSFKQFLGRPTINANGDVAFAAAIDPPDDTPADPLAIAPAGIFLWSGGSFSVVAPPGFKTDFGTLDLTSPINVLTALDDIDVAERTPALNDVGDVAFVASTFGTAGPGGALFVKRAGQDLVAVKKLGDVYENGTFQILGPPGLNNSGTLAFHGLVDGVTVLDGVFTLAGDTLTLLLRDGQIPDKLPVSFEIDPLLEIGDVVAINDAGDVVCTAGPIFDDSENAGLGDLEGSPGVVLIRGGVPLLVGFPGLEVETFGTGTTRISDLALGPEGNSRLAVPSLAPDGKVIFFAQLNNGSSQAILRADPDARTVRSLVRFGGASPDPSPAGGTYQAASSAPAGDSAGNYVFSARIDNATTSEALIWQPVSGNPVVTDIGDALPAGSNGFFGGPAFFPPILNDAGDVVFKSYVARGPALGIFRYRQGAGLEAVVRVHDAALSDGTPFSNLVGDPSMNGNGDVAFAATLQGRAGRGIFKASGGSIRVVALTLDDLVDADRPNAFLRTVSPNPAISDTGAVVFRGVVEWSRAPGVLPDVRENAVLVADPSGVVRVVAAQGQDSSGRGLPFRSFRDPTINGQTVLFRAPLGQLTDERVGLFVADGGGVRPVAIEGDDLGGMTLDTLQGKGLFDQAGDVFFSAKVLFAGGTDGAILRNGQAGFETVVQTGDPGPEGGVIGSLGRPAVSSNGHLALRMGFEPFTGGVPGIFVASDQGRVRSFLRVGENGAADINGRIVSVNQNVSLNASDHLAFLASIGGGTARSAVFLASPASGRVSGLGFRRAKPVPVTSTKAPKPNDRIKLSMVLQPGLLPAPAEGTDAARPVRQRAITITVADSRGGLWTSTLTAGDTRLRGNTLTKRRKATGDSFQRLRVQFGRGGTIRIAAASKPFDLSTKAQGLRHFDQNNAVILEPPFVVRVDVGEDGTSVTVPCTPKGRRFRCRG